MATGKSGRGTHDPDRPPRRRLPAAERRAQITGAAIEVFAREGYERAGTAAIAAEAGVSEAALYRYFPSKQAILRAVLERVRADVVEDVFPTAGAVAPLHELVAIVLDSAPARRDIRVLVSAIAVAHRDPDVAEALVDAFASGRSVIVGAMAAARAAGVVREDVDPEDAAWLLQGLLVAGLLRTNVRDDIAPSVVAAAQTLARLLSPPEPPGARP